MPRRRRRCTLFPYTTLFRSPESRAIAAMARDLFLKGEVDEVRVVATRFVNTLVQQPVAVEFLPIGDITGIEIPDRKSTRLNSSHRCISYAVFCLKKKITCNK